MNYYYQCYLIEVLDQIIFWTELSKEHPIVINTFADLTNKELPQELINEISGFTEMFQVIQNEAEEMRDIVEESIINEYDQTINTNKIMYLIKNFEIANKKFLRTIQKVSAYGKEDKIWQTLLEHITEEQLYALNLIEKFK